MVDTYTQGKLGLVEPARGSYVDTWDEPLYANWQTLEACISGTTTLTLTSSNVVLTVPTYPTYSNPPSVATSAQNLRLLLTGAPSVNLTIYIPATISGFWIVDDQTTGSTTITIKTTAGGSVGVDASRGNTLIIYSDGTDVKYADSGAMAIPSKLVASGSIVAYAGTSAPTGYLFCNGSAVSRTTYAALFAAIGTTWGIGDGLTTFNVPDLQDIFLRGSGSASVSTYEADSYLNHTHGVTDPGHFHQTGNVSAASPPYPPMPYGQGTEVAGIGGSAYVTAFSNLTQVKVTALTVNTSTTGGSETRPKNKRVLYIIKT